MMTITNKFNIYDRVEVVHTQNNVRGTIYGMMLPQHYQNLDLLHTWDFYYPQLDWMNKMLYFLHLDSETQIDSFERFKLKHLSLDHDQVVSLWNYQPKFKKIACTEDDLKWIG